MAKNNNTTGKQIRVGCKVRYFNRIWEVGYYNGTDVLGIFRFITHRTGEETCITDYVNVNDVEVI